MEPISGALRPISQPASGKVLETPLAMIFTILSAFIVSIWATAAAAQTSASAEDAKKGAKPAGPVVLGLDLSTVPLVAEPAKIADLFDPPLPGRPNTPGALKPSVFSMPLKPVPATTSPETFWLRYPLGLGRFYIQYRANNTRTTASRYYGPIEGDPFDRLKIEQAMSERLSAENYSPDDIFRVQEMFKTDNDALVPRAARLTQIVLDAKQETFRKRAYEPELLQIVERYSATMKKHGLEVELALIELGLRTLKDEIEALTVEVPIDQYTTALSVNEKLPAESAMQSAWQDGKVLGQATRGLRLAVLPSADTAKVGEPLRVSLIVENVAKQPIKFSAMSLLNDARPEVHDSNGIPLRTIQGNFSGRPRLDRFLLQPGERVVVAEPSLLVLPAENNGRLQPGIKIVVMPEKSPPRPSPIMVRFSLGLGGGERWQRGADGVMLRTSPARGEWTGTLASGDATIAVEGK
jgi:hypothetical protein